MNVFDEFLMGESENIEWCFENKHFLERLNENGINRQYIVDCIMGEEPINWEHLEGEKYSVIFKAPENKDYKEDILKFVYKIIEIDIDNIIMNKDD